MSEIAIITEKDLTSASQVLVQNTGYVTKYNNKHAILLAKAEKEGVKLTPETDKEINDFLVSAKTCVKKMEEDRKPYTQKANEFIKLFTTQENKLVNDLCPPLQAKRNASVAEYKKDEAEANRNAQLKLDQDKERITLLADAEQQLRNAYADILNGDKALLLNAFEGADAKTIDAVVLLLEECQPEFKEEQYEAIVPVLSSKLLEAAELDEIKIKAKAGKFERIQPHYEQEILNYAKHLLGLVPDRRAEIAAGSQSQVLAELKATEAQTIAEHQAQTDIAVEAKVNSEISQVVIESQIDQARRMKGSSKSSAIESYEIKVLDRQGWMEIFKLYFTHSGENDLGKVKLDTMKLFAERLAKSQDVKITSPFIEYEVKYKATARRSA